MSDLGVKIRAHYDDAAGKRTDFENTWLKDLRQYKGIYDPEVKAKLDPKRSSAYIRETRTKVRTLDARIMDLLFPANGDKNWEISNTPVPVVPLNVEQGLMQMIQATILQAGEQRQPNTEEINLAKKSYLKNSIDNMSKEIEDQLTEIKYRNIIRSVVHSGHLYGTGWLKGPLVNQTIEQHWQQVQNAAGNGMEWKLVKTNVNRPYAEFKSIWSCYPDMSATELEDCRFMCERHVMPRHKLWELTSRPEFNGELIRKYIEENPDGTATYLSYESTLYALNDIETKKQPPVKGSYEVIEFWGYVTGSDLLGLDADNFLPTIGDQLLNDFSVNIWLLGDEVIKVAVQPITGVTIPYYAYYFDKDETSIFGEGVASIMRDPQKLLNASIRAMIDGAAHSAGPQYEVNIDLLAEGEDPTDIGAFKVWQRVGKDADVAGKEVVRIKQIQSYTPEFMSMYSLFSRLGDEVTIIPRYMQGDTKVSGAARTSSGLSMLMGQANIGLSDLVKMFDDGITKPFITAMYNWNMQFNPREDIKGDMKIIARGSTALMAKEVRAQQIQMFLQMTVNPADILWVKRGNLLRKWAESTDIGADDMVRTQEEYDQELARRQEMEQAMQAEQQAALAQAQSQSQGQGGPGYNQLEQIISQQGELLKDLAIKVEELVTSAQRTRIPAQPIQ